MTKKTIKALDEALTLVKSELEDLRKKYDDLHDKHDQLEKKYEATIPKCDLCDEVFPTKSNLIKHDKIIHRKHGQFECKKCDKAFSEEWKLKAHEKSHKKYTCEKCNKYFQF